MARAQADSRDEPIEVTVERLDDQTVRELLVRSAMSHDDVARAIRMAVASESDRLAALRSEVDRALRTRRHLDYWQSTAWAREASPVVDALAAAAQREPSRDLVLLLERAVGHVVKVILRADDSNGDIGGLAHQLLELHYDVCAIGVADPVALAGWMVQFDFDDQDFFHNDPVRLAGALGEAGLAEYRAEIAERGVDGQRKFAHQYALKRLAVLDRDVPRIVELFGGELSNPIHFRRVAEAMLEIGREEDAFAWAQRGIRETSGQVAELYDLAVTILHERGDGDGALRFRREQHERHASATTYTKLRGAADAVGAWVKEVAAARETLAARDRGGLIDVLLADGETDAAWKVAATEGSFDPGLDRWQRLAGAREATDPAGAFWVYLRLADQLLLTAERRNYQAAIRLLKAARRVATPAKLAGNFANHVAALREKHHRRPTLIALLDKAKLA